MRQQSRRQSGSNNRLHRRARPCLEEMENRLLLSVSPSLLKNLDLQPPVRSRTAFSQSAGSLISLPTTAFMDLNCGVRTEPRPEPLW
jgi:hypothetical protein